MKGFRLWLLDFAYAMTCMSDTPAICGYTGTHDDRHKRRLLYRIRRSRISGRAQG